MSKRKTKTDQVNRPPQHRLIRGSGRRIVSLHVLVVGLPLAMSNISIFGATNPVSWTYDQFDLIKAALLWATVAVGLATWAVSVFRSGRQFRYHWTMAPAGLFLVWAVVSWAFATDQRTALVGTYQRYKGLITIFAYLGAYLVATQVLDGIGRIRGVARSAVYAASFAAAYGVVQYAGLDPLNWVNMGFNTRMAFATLGNPDLLGGYLALMLPIALGVALSEPRTAAGSRTSRLQP